MSLMAQVNHLPPGSRVGEKTATKACDTGNLAPNSFALPVGQGRIAELKHLSVCFVC